MSKSLIWGLVSCAMAGLVYYRAATQSKSVVPVDKAAEKLREAWADHHTVA